MGYVWMRDADDESVLELLKYVEDGLYAHMDDVSERSEKSVDADSFGSGDVTGYSYIGNRFEVSFIGMGSYSMVWYVRDTIINREYALKSSIDGSVMTDGKVLSDLFHLREVVDVYAYGDDFVLMEYVGGDTVADYGESGLDDMAYVEKMYTIIERIYEGGYLAFDLHGYNVKLVGGDVVIIDVGNFERIAGEVFSVMDVVEDFEKSRRLF